MRIALTLLALALAAPALAENDRRAELVGVYDGGQMEMAAGLELRATWVAHGIGCSPKNIEAK